MDTHAKLEHLLETHGWSKYRLAKECKLHESTLANIFNRDSTPSITTLETICKGFGITLSQFFAEHEMVELSPDLKELFDSWAPLTLEQKAAILQIIKVMNTK